ncbi:ATP-dependent helicase [Arcticibacterium luteifluviistationis]|uniref:ATP-dependent helicase n=1 Tax=Arcticibacterium luteifluviistationis TaxID=1784714 RepID=UPI001E305668|nr:UvrD-helicase domain-containing protein [Arcticibacterium luteifluviistationis]
MNNKYLEELNPPQKQAVIHPNGPLMIIAGAGSGKTRVLTYRIAWLIEQGVDPFNILSLTFTNKAAEEMKKRIEKIIGPNARNLWSGTFHSVFAKILRYEGKVLGYTSNFSIYDSDDSKSLVKTIVKEFGLDDKVYKPRPILNRISNAKNSLVSHEMYNESPIFREEDAGARMPEIGRIYRTYVLRCFQANAMDFDDLLYNTNVLFRDHLDILNKYQHKFKHVLVDEFQDTNVSQYLITRKLSAVHQNICVVGDDAQSIYAFRGANIQNILNFKKDYPELVTVKLEQNYRSTKNIVNAANSLIKKNTEQLDKNVFTDNDSGKKIEVLKAASDNEEGRIISNKIFDSKLTNGLKNEDFAILYRTNAQSRAFEEALRKMNIKYRIIGGLSFYQRKEIKDLLAYLRFTVNQQDEEAFKRIINLPKRGIGSTSVAKVMVSAAESGKSFWEVICHANEFMTGAVVPKLLGFGELIQSYTLELEKDQDAHSLATHIAKTTGILRELYADKTVEGLARYENIQELLNSVKQFVDDDENEDKSLTSFLQTVSLYSTADADDEDGDSDKVTMMTIHGSKGLEFSHVFVVGLEENLFPSQMMLNNRADLEEERRLFYVAITRAEQDLTLSYAESRYNWGRLTYCEPSRFLLEIDEEYLDMPKDTKPTAKHFGNDSDVLRSFRSNDSGGTGSSNSTGNKMPPTRPLSSNTSAASKREQVINKLKPVSRAVPQVEHKPSTNFVPSSPSELKAGIKVEHAKFGFGRITAMDMMGNSHKATVVFDTVGEKTLLLSFAKLRAVE